MLAFQCALDFYYSKCIAILDRMLLSVGYSYCFVDP